MFYVYIIKNKVDGALYYGYTNDLKRRIVEHNKTSRWKLIYYEAYSAEKDARTREQMLKQYGQTRTHLKKRLEVSLDEQN